MSPLLAAGNVRRCKGPIGATDGIAPVPVAAHRPAAGRSARGSMKGVITGKEVFLHSFKIVRLWGVSTYLQCCWAAITRKPSTFLGVLYPSRDGMSDASARWRPTS